MPLPVWVSVSSSNVSSSVPKPPGRQMNPPLSLISISLRVKKYFMLTYFSSPAMIGLAACSNGSRIDTPIECSRPAPSIAACMIPGPAPVMTIQPACARSAATSRAALHRGSFARTRAEPKIVTLRASWYGANISNASPISASAAPVIFMSTRSGRMRNSSVSDSTICDARRRWRAVGSASSAAARAG